MRKTWIAIGGLMLVTAGLWCLADTVIYPAEDTRAFHDSVLQLTGIVAIVAMCAGAVLAARPRFVEPWLDGMDKMYLAHKWLGILALAASVLHWWYASGSHIFASGDGPPGGGHRPPADGAAQQAISLIDSLRGPAHPIGEWGFYALILVVVIALIRRIPYRLFAKTHLLTIPLLLALILHSAVLAKADYWSKPIGWLLALVLIAGLLAALISLLREIGLMPHATGTVEGSHWYPELKVLEINIRADDGWRGHQAGQFAFVATRRFEGAHPFTIASSWDPATGRITFIAKELGDYTSQLREEFTTDRKVWLEGPYGRFVFDDDRPVQIWVGAGVGITPFVARMRHLARQGARPGQQVYLFHSTTEVSPEGLQRMQDDAAAAGVALHITRSKTDPLLDGAAIRTAVPGWRDSSLWFCGPAGFGTALRRDFIAAGLPANRFHQERFTMR